ncbi:MAG: NAD-dependent epimerase/dehydratase family protein [Deltaproteobacteria bacterium]|nr:NAD-dependent epimerase/dehydratase family protein [Deltaproteobacteria bacterium]
MSGLALVTGASGFIGSQLTCALVERGWRVRAACRRPPEGDGIEPFACDLTAASSLPGIASGVERVFHCAGLLGRWGTRDESLHAVNVGGSLNLLDSLAQGSCGVFVHVSAGGVSGPRRERIVDEEVRCAPRTPYERSKHEAEQRVLERAARLGLPVVVARPTFTYGPGDSHKLGLFRAVQRGLFAFIGEPRSVIHPVFVQDLSRGLLLAAERGRPGEIYILGGPRPVTKRALVHAIADALGAARPRLRLPRPLAELAAAGLERAGRAVGFEPPLTRGRVSMLADNFGYSIRKARRELGYAPRFDLQQGVALAVRDYRARGLL